MRLLGGIAGGLLENSNGGYAQDATRNVLGMGRVASTVEASPWARSIGDERVLEDPF